MKRLLPAIQPALEALISILVLYYVKIVNIHAKLASIMLMSALNVLKDQPYGKFNVYYNALPLPSEMIMPANACNVHIHAHPALSSPINALDALLAIYFNLTIHVFGNALKTTILMILYFNACHVISPVCNASHPPIASPA